MQFYRIQGDEMSKYPTTRNFGFGKQIKWAGRKALEQYYGNGHFATVSTHAQHWRLFCRWIKATRDIRDAREITQLHLEEYADMLCKCVMDETLDVAYAQNLISSVNVVMEALRGPLPIRIESPSDWVGRRCTYRTEPPTGQHWHQVTSAADHLAKHGMPRARIVVLLCRHFGVRLREAVLADISEWIKQVEDCRAIDVRKGTKGGRGNEVSRWIDCDPMGLYLLTEAKRVCRELGCGDNMLLPNEAYVSFVSNGEINQARLHLHKFNIKGYHELRAAYACQRYQDLTGHLAPVFMANEIAGDDIHLKAVEVITNELGHDRTEVMDEYIGRRSARQRVPDAEEIEEKRAKKTKK
jgi:hypothetical protein